MASDCIITTLYKYLSLSYPTEYLLNQIYHNTVERSKQTKETKSNWHRGQTIEKLTHNR